MVSLPKPSKLIWLKHDSLVILNQGGINHLKKLAKYLQKSSATPITRSQALDAVSQSFGFVHWAQLLEIFQYEQSSSVHNTRYLNSPENAVDCYTDKQLHGAAYRHLNIKPIEQIIQFTVDQSDYFKALDCCYLNDQELFERLLLKGIVPDRSFECWLKDNDPFVNEYDGYDTFAYRFLHSEPLTFTEVLTHLDLIFMDLNLLCGSSSFRTVDIWIDGKLSPDSIQSYKEDDFKITPCKELPTTAYPRVYG